MRRTPRPGTGVGNYNTRAADNGPSHVIVSGLQPGQCGAGRRPGTLQNAGATRMTTHRNIDDEDGVSTLPTVNTGTTSVAMTVRAYQQHGARRPPWSAGSTSTGTATSWTQVRTSASVAVPASSGGANYTVNFTGFAAPAYGDYLPALPHRLRGGRSRQSDRRGGLRRGRGLPVSSGVGGDPGQLQRHSPVGPCPGRLGNGERARATPASTCIAARRPTASCRCWATCRRRRRAVRWEPPIATRTST